MASLRKTQNCHLDGIKSNEIRCESNIDHANIWFSFTRQVNRQFNNMRLIWSKHKWFHLRYWVLEYLIIVSWERCKINQIDFCYAKLVQLLLKKCSTKQTQRSQTLSSQSVRIIFAGWRLTVTNLIESVNNWINDWINTV